MVLSSCVQPQVLLHSCRGNICVVLEFVSTQLRMSKYLKLLKKSCVQPPSVSCVHEEHTLLSQIWADSMFSTEKELPTTSSSWVLQLLSFCGKSLCACVIRYRRAADFLLHSFSAGDFSQFGFKSVRIISVQRVVNREAEAAFELLK